MKCAGCGAPVPASASECPDCGARIEDSGVYRMRTVIVAAQGTRARYDSVEEVPARFRDALRASVGGANAGTVVIADRAGIERIAGNLPRPAGNQNQPGARRLSAWAMWAMLGLVAAGVLAAAAKLLATRWR